MEKETKRAGICLKCGRHTDDLRLTIDTTVSDEPTEVCPECFDKIEADNRLFAKAVLVAGALVMVPVILILVVCLIISSVC